MKHVCTLFGGVSNLKTVVRCGFIITSAAADAAAEHDVLVEDEFASLLGFASVTMGFLRLRRTLHLVFGMPRRLKVHLATGDVELEKQCLQEYKSHACVFASLLAYELDTVPILKTKDRHVLHTPACKQMVVGCEASFYDITADLVMVSKTHLSLFSQTQIAEDAIGAAKNTRITDAQKKFKNPEATMAAVLRSATMETRHKFKTPGATMPLGSKIACLDRSAFVSDKKRQSLPSTLWKARTRVQIGGAQAQTTICCRLLTSRCYNMQRSTLTPSLASALLGSAS